MAGVIVKGGASDIVRPLSNKEEGAIIVLSQKWIIELGLTYVEARAKAYKALTDLQSAGMIDMVAIPNQHNITVLFPIFKNDTVESIIARHYEVDPVSCKVAIEKMASLDNGGFSGARLMRLLTEMPASLKAVIHTWDNTFFSDKKNWDKVKSIAPKYFTKRAK